MTALGIDIGSTSIKGAVLHPAQGTGAVVGPVEKAPEVNVNVATAIQTGPPAPAEPRELGSYLAKLNEIAAQQGLMGGEAKS